MRLGACVLLLAACDSLPDGSDADTAPCSSACDHSASVCGLASPPPNCSARCALSKYTSAELDCIRSAATCDDAQRCGLDLPGGARPRGVARVGQQDPSGCAPSICVCADGTMNSCDNGFTDAGPCPDPTATVCQPNCADHEGFARTVPATNLLCGQ